MLPGERTQLHIFEPRYKQLLADCELNGIQFGIPYHQNKQRATIGCVVKLANVIKRYPSGELDVVVQCVGVVRIVKEFARLGNKLYPGGLVQRLEVNLSHRPSPAIAAAFGNLLELTGGSRTKVNVENYASLGHVIAALQLGASAKAAIARAQSLQRQEVLVLQAIKYAQLLFTQEQAAEDGFYLN